MKTILKNEEIKMRPVIEFAREPAMEIRNDDRCVIKTVYPENIFRFPEGILGFENIKEYIFLMNDKIKPFLFMQALHNSDLSFICVETFLIKPDYNVKIPRETIQFLELEKPEDVLLLSLVTVRKKVEDITANLMSPVVVNVRNSTARQVIFEKSSYPVQYPVWSAIENSSAVKVG
jgi:flagellar assembly factor FliW